MHVVKVREVGDTLVVTIPTKVRESFQIEKGDAVEVICERDSPDMITLKRLKPTTRRRK